MEASTTSAMGEGGGGRGRRSPGTQTHPRKIINPRLLKKGPPNIVNMIINITKVTIFLFRGPIFRTRERIRWKIPHFRMF